MTEDWKDLGKKLKKTKPAYEDFCRQLAEIDKRAYPEINNPLFHYTKMDALESILTTGNLWLTDIFKQKNDPFEIISGMEICYELLRAETERARYSGTRFFSDKFIDILSKHIEQAGHFFLFCTSRVHDDPHQWMLFTDGGKGICLEFASGFAKTFSDTPENDDGSCSNGSSPVFDVYYDDKKLQENLNPIIEACIKGVEQGLQAANPDKEEGWIFLRDMSTILAAHCIQPCVEYKPQKFFKENEVRFLRVVRMDRIPHNRKVGNEIKSYIEHPLNKKDIKAVWLGPLAPEGAEEQIRKKLDQNGWTDTEIKVSGIPYSAFK